MISISIKRYDKLIFGLFLISVFFFKTPNIYLIPFFRNAILTTQGIARILAGLAFIFILFSSYVSDRSFFRQNTSKLIPALILLFFASLSLSIIPALNMFSFLSRYKDIILGFIYFFLFYFFRNKYKSIISVMLLAVFFNLIYQLFIVFRPDIFRNIFSYFVYDKHFNFVLSNMMRGRIYADLYDEITLPLLALLIAKDKLGSRKRWYYFLFIGIAFFSFISNFRSRILMLIIGIIGASYILIRQRIRTIIILISAIIITGYFVNMIMLNIFQITFLDRFSEADRENLKNINSRLIQLNLAQDMGRYSLFGVGLGNYYDHLDQDRKVDIPNRWLNYIRLGAEEYVHNIFGTILAESGYINLIVFFLILLAFIRQDLVLLRTGKDWQIAFIFSFYSLFFYSLFNPPVPASFQVLFWGIRGLLL